MTETSSKKKPKKLTSPSESWSYLRPFLPPRSKLRMGLIGLTAFAGSACESAVLVLVTLTADSLIRQSQSVALGPFTFTRTQAVWVALALVILRVLLTTASAWVSSRFSALAMRSAQRSLSDAYLATSHPARAGHQIGDVSAVLVNHGRFTGDLANALTLVAASVCALLAFGGASIAVNPLATAGIAVIGGILITALRPLRKRSRHAALEFADTARSLSTSMTEIETIHREVEVFDVSQPVGESVATQLHDASERYRRLRFLAATIPQIFQTTMLGAAVLSLLLVVNNPGATDLASIGAVVLLLVRSMSAAQQLVMANQRVLEFGAYSKGLTELITKFNSQAPTFGDSQPSSLSPVSLQNVRFSYDETDDVLKDFSVELRKGDLVGVVGPSGAGKSTLIELLLRLRSPSDGTVLLGGSPANDVSAAEFAHRLAFVPQQPNLITGTVAENVAFYRDVSDDEVRRAIKMAHLEAEIDALPDGIHTRLGSDDRALSGGQRQRLTIARALVGDPEIVILDEPTSALDAVSEQAIRATMSELQDNRIVIVVAHRYSTLRSCSRILVLRDGRLDADASPDEVAKHSDFFRTMVGEEVS